MIDDNALELLRDVGEQVATSLGLYVADICTAAGDDHTDFIIGRSYPTMRRIALRNSLGAELAAGGGSAAEALAVIRRAFAGERVVFIAHNATPTFPYGRGPTYLGELAGFRGELDTLLNELAREHPTVTFVACRDLGKRWRRDPRDSGRFVEQLGTWCESCGADASGPAGMITAWKPRTAIAASFAPVPVPSDRGRLFRTCKAAACVDAAARGNLTKESDMIRYTVLEFRPPQLLTLDVRTDLSEALEYIRKEHGQNAQDQLDPDGGVPMRFLAISVSQGE